MRRALAHPWRLLTLLTVGVLSIVGDLDTGLVPGAEVLAAPPPAAAPATVAAPAAPTEVAAGDPQTLEAPAGEVAAPLWWKGEVIERIERSPERVEALPASRPGPRRGTMVYDAVLEDDLFLQTDLVFKGISVSHTLSFPRPQTWKLVEGTAIHLKFDHSSSLLPDRSSLTVSINDMRVKSVQLTAQNITDGELVVPIPLGALEDYNTLKIEVWQHYTNECEDPFDASLWTKVSRRSFFRLVYQPAVIPPDLLRFPLPFFDPLGFGTTVMNWVLPKNPAPGTVEALGVIAAGFGRELSYRPMAASVPVDRAADAQGNVIVVGTPGENPEVQALVGDRLREVGPGQGLLAVVPHPTRPESAILVVTGADPSGVLMAARALTTERRHEVLSGAASVITTFVTEPASQPYARPDFVPPTETTFTLAQLGQPDVTVRGFYASSVGVPVRTFPNMQFFEGQQRLRIHYAYGAQLHPRLSTLEIRWNNVSLKSLPLDDPEGSESEEEEIAIPAEIMSPYNSLEFVFHLYPRSYQPCETKTDKQLFGTIFDDTALHVPRYEWVEMPDLGKLQYGLYPFGVLQDLSDTLVVTPDNPDVNDLMAGIVLSGELGRSTRAGRVSLRLLRGDSVSPADRSRSHMILLGTGNANSEIASLGDKRPLAVGGGRKGLSKDDDLVLQAIDPSAHGSLEQMISPYGSDRVILIVQGFTRQYLISALRMVSDPGLLTQLAGNVALLGVDQNLRTLDVGPTESWGSVPVRVVLRSWGRANFWTLMIVFLGVLLLAYMVLNFLLGRYRERNHGDDPGPGGGDRGGAPGGGGGASAAANPAPVASAPSAMSAAPSEPSIDRPTRRAPPRRLPPGAQGDEGRGGDGSDDDR